LEFSSSPLNPAADLMVDTLPELEKAKPCVLVVEDEGLIRMMVSETLIDAGYRVSEAGSAKEALNAIGNSSEDIHAVVLDVGLPDANGEALIEKIRAQKPGMPIIMTTGYDTNELRRKAAADPLLRILTKPYQPDLLDVFLKEWGISA
jgi:DNA-binding NtrC family response regulator